MKVPLGVSLPIAALLFFAFAPLAASGAPGGVRAPAIGHEAMPQHMPILRSGPSALTGSHGSTAEPAERANSRPSPGVHSVQPVIESPVPARRPFLPWWFRRRPMAAPELPLA